MKTSLRSVVACGSIALGALVGAAGSADAKQCVWNKAGFILEVHWYKQGDILYDEKGEFYVRPQEGTGGKTAPTPVKPVQYDVYPVAQGRCYEGSDQLIAVLAIKDGDIFNTLMTTGVAIFVGGGSAVGAGAICVLSAGTLCVAAGAGAAVATTAWTAGAQAVFQVPTMKGTIPNAFAITIPGANKVMTGPGFPPGGLEMPLTGKDRWLDVWGTVMSPQIGPGGPL
jgi:hypothetical protein